MASLLGPGIPMSVEHPGLIAERDLFVPSWPLDYNRDVESKTRGGTKSVRLEKLPWPVDFSIYSGYQTHDIDPELMNAHVAEMMEHIQERWKDDPRNKAAPGLQFFLRDVDAEGDIFRSLPAEQRDVRSSPGLHAVLPRDIRNSHIKSWGRDSIEALTRDQSVSLEEMNRRLKQYTHFPENSKQKHVLFWLQDIHRFDFKTNRYFTYDEKNKPDPYPHAGATLYENDIVASFYRDLYVRGQLVVVRIGFSTREMRVGEFEEVARYFSAIQTHTPTRSEWPKRFAPRALRIISVQPVLNAIAEAQADRYVAGVVLPSVARLHQSGAASAALGSSDIQRKVKSFLGGPFEPI